MEKLIFKIKILILRVLGYEKPLRVAILKYLSLKFSTFRPHYETILYEASKTALKLGAKEISVLELGVAGGDGIKSLHKYKKKIEKILNIKIFIVGFDSGSGLPEVTKKEDLPFFWKAGDYTNKNLSSLETNYNDVKIFTGEISETLETFINQNNHKIGCIFFDLDLYSSTKSFLDIIPLLSKNNLLLPRTLCYFDDLFIADYGLDDSNGEPLAISNFNNDNTNFKLGRAYDNVSDFKFPLAKNQIFTLHDYENENYNKYIGIYEAESLSSNKNKKSRSILND